MMTFCFVQKWYDFVLVMPVCCCRAKSLGGNTNTVFSAHLGSKCGSGEEVSWVFWKLAGILLYRYLFPFFNSPCFLSVLSGGCSAESDCEKQSLVAPLNSSVVVLEEAAIQ